VAPPVFKTGLAGIAFAGGFDSLPPPPKNANHNFSQNTSRPTSHLGDGRDCGTSMCSGTGTSINRQTGNQKRSL